MCQRDWNWTVKNQSKERLVFSVFILALAPSRFFGCALLVFSEDLPVFGDLKKLQTPSLTMAQFSVLQFVCVETLLNRLYVCILRSLL